MHFKRKKCKRQVRCTLCTPDRWKGNKKSRFKDKEQAIRKRSLEEEFPEDYKYER